LRFVTASDAAFELGATGHSRSSMPCEIIGSDESQRTFDVLMFTSEHVADPAVRVLHRHRSLPSAWLSFQSKPFR
jgi:hypothetical protein